MKRKTTKNKRPEAVIRDFERSPYFLLRYIEINTRKGHAVLGAHINQFYTLLKQHYVIEKHEIYCDNMFYELSDPALINAQSAMGRRVYPKERKQDNPHLDPK